MMRTGIFSVFQSLRRMGSSTRMAICAAEAIVSDGFPSAEALK
jgi:hypothetical protein